MMDGQEPKTPWSSSGFELRTLLLSYWKLTELHTTLLGLIQQTTEQKRNLLTSEERGFPVQLHTSMVRGGG